MSAFSTWLAQESQVMPVISGTWLFISSLRFGLWVGPVQGSRRLLRDGGPSRQTHDAQQDHEYRCRATQGRRHRTGDAGLKQCLVVHGLLLYRGRITGVCGRLGQCLDTGPGVIVGHRSLPLVIIHHSFAYTVDLRERFLYGDRTRGAGHARHRQRDRFAFRPCISPSGYASNGVTLLP